MSMNGDVHLRYKWTLIYIAVIVTILLVLGILGVA